MVLLNRASGATVLAFRRCKKKYPISKLTEVRDAMRSGSSQGSHVALIESYYLEVKAGVEVNTLEFAYVSSATTLCRQLSRKTIGVLNVQSPSLRRGAITRRNNVSRVTPRAHTSHACRSNSAKVESKGSPGIHFVCAPFHAPSPLVAPDGGDVNFQWERLVAKKSPKFIARLPSQLH